MQRAAGTASIMRHVDPAAMLAHMDQDLLQRWRVVRDSLYQDKQRLRRFVRALWAVGIIFGFSFLYRRRKQIAASIRGGVYPHVRLLLALHADLRSPCRKGGLAVFRIG